MFVPRPVAGIKADYKHNFCVTSVIMEAGAPVTIATLLAAPSKEARDAWVQTLTRYLNPRGTSGIHDFINYASTTTRVAAGVDVGASGLQAGAQTNLEQMKFLDQESLSSLRTKQLLAVLTHMGVDTSGVFEKRELVDLIIRNRGNVATDVS